MGFLPRNQSHRIWKECHNKHTHSYSSLVGYWQEGRLAISADAVPPVRALAFIYNHRRATVTVLQSMADDNGYLKRIGLVVTSVHRRAVTVADHHLEPLFAGNHLGRSFLPGRKRSA